MKHPLFGHPCAVWKYRLLLAAAAVGSLTYDFACFGGNVARVVVWVEGASDAGLVERIKGQTHGLPFEIVGAATSALAVTSRRRQLDLASLLAEREQAQAVVWRVERSIIIFVPKPTPGRLLIRAVGEERSSNAVIAPGMQTSSDLETGAVIVRAALVALAAGDEVGDVASVPHESDEITPPSVITTSKAQTLSPPTDRSASHAAFANAVAIALEDGLGNAASIGWAVTAGLRRQWASVGVVGELFPSQTVQPVGVPRASRLSRQAMGLVASVRLLHGRRWQLALEGECGINALRLTTDPIGMERERTAQTSRGYVGSILEATLRLTEGPTALSLLVGAGLRAVTSPPVLYAQADAVREMNTLSPRVFVGLQISTNEGNP